MHRSVHRKSISPDLSSQLLVKVKDVFTRVDGCDYNNAGCNGTCVNNYDGTFNCSCSKFKVLGDDGKSCEGKEERPVSAPLLTVY